MTTSMRARPGRNLLVALEILGKEFADFAVEAKMSTGDRQACRVALRKYTHPSAGTIQRPTPPWPNPDPVETWGEILGIDPEFFYLKTPTRAAFRKAAQARLEVDAAPTASRPFKGLAWRNPKLACAERVRLYFEANPMVKVTAPQLAEAIDAKRKVTNQALHRGARSSFLQKEGRGFYWHDPALASGTDSAAVG